MTAKSFSARRLVAETKPLYWRARYAAWRPQVANSVRRAGYAVLVPVPGDLPWLVDVALSVLATQDAAHRLDTIVIPDVSSVLVRRTVESYVPRWGGSLRLLDLARPEKVVLPRLRDAARNHPAQLLRGTAATDATHVIFHDADLFPLDSGLHERTYEACADAGVDVGGVEGPWDTWFAAHDRQLVATWEMCARVEWMRSFPPWMHFGHEATVAGERHVFDTTFHPQWLTEQARLRTINADNAFIHFNYVISTYRKFQRSTGPYRDQHFRLLLLRLLIDAFDSSGSPTDIPILAELQAGLEDPSRRVFYDRNDAPLLRTMVAKLRSILAGPWAGVTGNISRGLDAFEAWAGGEG